jgi:hypothetical protein
MSKENKLKRSFFESLKKREDFKQLGRLNQDTTSVHALQGDTGVLVSITLNGKCRIRLCVGKVCADMLEPGLPALESSYIFANTEAQEDSVEQCCKILAISKESLFIIILQMEVWARKRFRITHPVLCSGEDALWAVITCK